MASSSRRSSRPVHHSLSTTGKLVSTATPSRSSSFASSTSTFSLRSSSDFLYRSSSPTRISMNSQSPSGSSVRFLLDRSLSPKRSFVLNQNGGVQKKPGNRTAPTTRPRKTCLCSPTTHPGSFRCSLHKKSVSGNVIGASPPGNSNRLNMRRSAMTNSLVRIGTVEGDLMKRALAALIRPSSHQQRRREDFRPRPSRLSKIS